MSDRVGVDAKQNVGRRVAVVVRNVAAEAQNIFFEASPSVASRDAVIRNKQWFSGVWKCHFSGFLGNFSGTKRDSDPSRVTTLKFNKDDGLVTQLCQQQRQLHCLKIFYSAVTEN